MHITHARVRGSAQESRGTLARWPYTITGLGLTAPLSNVNQRPSSSAGSAAPLPRRWFFHAGALCLGALSLILMVGEGGMGLTLRAMMSHQVTAGVG